MGEYRGFVLCIPFPEGAVSNGIQSQSGSQNKFISCNKNARDIPFKIMEGDVIFKMVRGVKFCKSCRGSKLKMVGVNKL